MLFVIYQLPKENQNDAQFIKNYEKNVNNFYVSNLMFRYFENPVTFGDCFN